MSAERIKCFSAFGNCQSPNSRVAALTSMSLAPPKPKRQSSVDCGRPKGRNQSETKDQQNAQLVVSALDLAVEERRLAEFRTRCLVQEDLIIIIPSPFRTETTQAYFPEAESQRTRQVQRNKLVFYLDKYVEQFEQIHCAIRTITFYNLNKYVHFAIWTIL